MLHYSSYAKDIRKLFLVGGRKRRRSRKRKNSLDFPDPLLSKLLQFEARFHSFSLKFLMCSKC